MKSKVFVIALDGATFDLIRPWTEQGHLPSLKRLMDGGIHGPLQSTYPPLTGPAWSSFMTGKSPGKHGVLEFFRRQLGTYKQALNSRLDIDGPSLWRLLSDAGKKVVVMGLPLSYPPEPVNGSLITGLLTPANSRDFTYPIELLDELEAELGEYRLRHDQKYRQADPYAFISEQYDIVENNTEAALYLMKNKPWDFFMVHFLGTDRIQHEFWHLLDPTHPQHEPAERQRLGDVILDFFKVVDTHLGRLLAELDEQTVILVMSDHGFGPIHQFINLNVWLLQEGLLSLKRTVGARWRYLLFRLGVNYSTIGRVILKLGFGKQAKTMGRARREELQRRLFLSLDDVDWSRSKVYSMGNFGQLYINLKGREPEGIVSPGEEYETLLEELTQRLQRLVDPTGKAVIEKIFRRDEVYEGPYAEHAPDLMFFTTDMKYKAMGLSDFSSPHLFEPVYGTTGHHRTNGIMIWHGAEIMPVGEWHAEAQIHDLAPTILYLMGLPIPVEMDGRVLTDILTPEFRHQHVLSYTESNTSSPHDDELSSYNEEDEAELMERLRALGYAT